LGSALGSLLIETLTDDCPYMDDNLILIMFTTSPLNYNLPHKRQATCTLYVLINIGSDGRAYLLCHVSCITIPISKHIQRICKVKLCHVILT